MAVINMGQVTVTGRATGTDQVYRTEKKTRSSVKNQFLEAEATFTPAYVIELAATSHQDQEHETTIPAVQARKSTLGWAAKNSNS